MDIDPGDVVEAVAEVAESAFDVAEATAPRRREESGCLPLLAALIGIAAVGALIVYAVYVIVVAP